MNFEGVIWTENIKDRIRQCIAMGTPVKIISCFDHKSGPQRLKGRARSHLFMKEWVKFFKNKKKFGTSGFNLSFSVSEIQLFENDLWAQIIF